VSGRQRLALFGGIDSPEWLTSAHTDESLSSANFAVTERTDRTRDDIGLGTKMPNASQTCMDASD
jgi:hypothetical protein